MAIDLGGMPRHAKVEAAFAGMRRAARIARCTACCIAMEPKDEYVCSLGALHTGSR